MQTSIEAKILSTIYLRLFPFLPVSINRYLAAPYNVL